MEDPDLTKEWYVTHEGQQFGPVSLDDLKYEAERGKLNPRLDMVWKDGMEDWIPSGEIEGLFQKNKDASGEAVEDSATAFTEFQPEETPEERLRNEGRWPGVSRSVFFFMSYIFPVIWLVALSFVSQQLAGSVAADQLGLGVAVLSFLPIIVSLIALLKRFQNLAMTRLWFLGLFIPLLNIWLGYRLLVCPEGYADHKKLDTIGWILAILYWGSFLLAIAAAIFVAVSMTQTGPDDPYRETIENFIRKIEEERQIRSAQ
ncbi:GYF domain-containing protein [Luteolibacter algae]|uniref:GYF domain-containing protein n=1 Tax=Luteolibacter algae TaxID=454151 RepID=A0ABW5D3J2_9BACT